MTNFHTRTQNLIKEIKALIKDKDSRPRYMSDSQLESIVDELCKMDYARNSEKFYPYYPRGIADSWDYNDELGSKLMEHLEIYCSL